MRSCFFTQEKTTPRGGFKMSKILTFRHKALTTWQGGTEMVHMFEAEDGSGNFIYVSSRAISLSAQNAIDDSSVTVKAEVSDEPDDRGQLLFIRFLDESDGEGHTGGSN